MTNQEREEFELVAKACGALFKYHDELPLASFNNGIGWLHWDPKTNNSDAMRLAVSLYVNIEFDNDAILVNGVISAYNVDDREAATRLGIWRAAVEYARSLK